MNWTRRYRYWEGTASELAATLANIARELGHEDDGVSPSVRLVRHYVQQGMLRRPQKRGREAIFGFRQIVEFLVARYLAQDGWPLAKIGELNRSTKLPLLLDLVPGGSRQNRAQRLVVLFQEQAQPKNRSPSIRNSSHSPGHMPSAIGSPKEMLHLDANFEVPAVPSRRDTLVRLELAPWCHVFVDPEAIRQLSRQSIEQLGRVLAQSLILEQQNTGDSK